MKKPNNLINESSPYLQQHAYNPVDWYPWGEEAFKKASREDKPIFLSIGYSTCHWCHVMEKESFEDEEVASLLNGNFVSIKVDREERPDIDNLFIEVCQVVTGGAGWPLTIIMTPHKEPFFAGTYYPKHGNYGRPGIMDVLSQITTIWKERREDIINAKDSIMEYLQTQKQKDKHFIDQTVFVKCLKQFEERFDPVYGGFGTAPKFPTPHNINFLIRFYLANDKPSGLTLAFLTLKRMRMGGIYDHVGGGFHRYSTDQYWLVPHFEKMLYDQALITLSYLELYTFNKDKWIEKTITETLQYVNYQMTSPDGGFAGI